MIVVTSDAMIDDVTAEILTVETAGTTAEMMAEMTVGETAEMIATAEMEGAIAEMIEEVVTTVVMTTVVTIDAAIIAVEVEIRIIVSLVTMIEMAVKTATIVADLAQDLVPASVLDLPMFVEIILLNPKISPDLLLERLQSQSLTTRVVMGATLRDHGKLK